MATDIAARVTRWLGHPLAIVAVPPLCWLLEYLVPDDRLTFWISVFSLSVCQILLNAGRRGDAAVHAKLAELIHAIEGARNEVAEAEKLDEAEIADLRRDADRA